MTDQCKFCTHRGDLKACLADTCSHHENWYAKAQQDVIDQLLKGITEYVELKNAKRQNTGKTVVAFFALEDLLELYAGEVS